MCSYHITPTRGVYRGGYMWMRGSPHSCPQRLVFGLDTLNLYRGWTHSLSPWTHSLSPRTHSNPAGNTQVATRKNEIVNRLEKTKKWEEPDLQAALIQRQREERTEKAREVSSPPPSAAILPRCIHRTGERSAAYVKVLFLAVFFLSLAVSLLARVTCLVFWRS